ncbi:MAG: DUF4405 domain-containing protein [Rhodospirillales bacterium]|nr:DUF4405 domain-containing protein [Rhodospirillales bacterium]
MPRDKKKLNLRSLTAFIVAWAFIVAIITGTVLYVVPQGRVAYWVDWQLFALDKTQWGNIHIVFGVIFIAAGIWHLYYNWKPFKKYLADRVPGHIHVRKEVIISTTLAVMVVAGAIADVPPVSWVFDLNETVKATWVDSPDYEPPYGHAEESSLASLTRRTNIDLDMAVAELREKGVKFDSSRDSLKKIAILNDTNALSIFRMIKKFEVAPPQVDLVDLTPETVENMFEGTGVGRKALADICQSTGHDLEMAVGRLLTNGIEAQDGETLRQIGDRYDLAPIEILKTALVSQYKPMK